MPRTWLSLKLFVAAATFGAAGVAAMGGPSHLFSPASNLGAGSTADTPAAAEPVHNAAPATSDVGSTAADALAALPEVTTGPSEPKPDPERPDARHPHERIRLHCEAVSPDAHRSAVKCVWSASESRHFAGYRLLRGDEDERTVVFQTRDRDQTAFADLKVEPGGAYHYLVQVVGSHGHVIGESNPAAVKVPPRNDDKVRLVCHALSHEGRHGVACKWSEATSERAAGYVLVRSVDGGEREAIHRSGLDGPRHHLDGPLRPGHRYTYAVLVVDSTGQVIGGSEPVTVGWPSKSPSVTDPPSK